MRNLFAFGLLLTACTVPDDVKTNRKTQAATVYNGPYVNGPYVNGPYVNGPYVNGPYVNGPYVNGPYVNGPTLGGELVDGLRVEGGRLVADRGEDLIGLVLETTTGGPETPQELQRVVQFRVDDIEEGELYNRYTISYSILTQAVQEGAEEQTWSPLCGTHEEGGEPRRAIPDLGFWDYRVGVPGGGGRVPDSNVMGGVTFACEGGAIYKCMDLGYLPWASEDVYKAHEACVRMVRLDLCGDGRAWTMEGTLLHVHDGLAIQEDTSGELEGTWQPEAGWTPDGAQWIAGMRVSQFKNFDISLEAYLGATATNDLQVDCQVRLGRFAQEGFFGATPDLVDPVHENCAFEPCLVTKFNAAAESSTVYDPGDQDDSCTPEMEAAGECRNGPCDPETENCEEEPAREEEPCNPKYEKC